MTKQEFEARELPNAMNAAIDHYLSTLSAELPKPVAYILPRHLKMLNFKGMSVPVDALPYATNKEDSTVELETTVPLFTRDQLLQALAVRDAKWQGEVERLKADALVNRNWHDSAIAERDAYNVAAGLANVEAATLRSERDAALGMHILAEQSAALLLGEIGMLKAELAALTAQEPVAWLHTGRMGGTQAFTNEPPPMLKKECQPLYAAPVPAQSVNAELVEVILKDARNTGREIFKYSCNHSKDAIEWFYAETTVELAKVKESK